MGIGAAVKRKHVDAAGRLERIRKGILMCVRRAAGAPSPFPLAAFVRASSFHVGAAAAAVALRKDLVETGQLAPEHFDEAFAVSRVTPGTNVLAMYVLLGDRLRGWRGALAALLIGAFVPSLIVVLLGVVYVEAADRPLTQLIMQGARAGALAVLAWAIIQLARPQVVAQRWRGAAIVAVTSGLIWSGAPTFLVLLVAGALGAFVLREAA